MANASSSIRKTFDLVKARAPDFFSSQNEIDKFAGKRPYTHIIRRAWEELKLNGVYCVDQRPTVYFKQVRRFDDAKLKKLHRRFWNQGVATLLVVSGPDQVKVFSGMAPPATDDEKLEDAGRLVQIFHQTADVLELQHLLKRVESGAIYQENKDCFKQECAVDHYLLENLRAARNLLVEKLGEKNLKTIHTIHALLGRILFTCYLTDRKIINGRQFKAAGAPEAKSLKDLLNTNDPEQARDALFDLFELLQEKFNGSMFDDSIDMERKVVSAEAIKVLRIFLNGEPVGSQQLELFFWEYDFSIIPIETISAIYEDFLAAEDAAEDKKEKRGSGAYYTPKHLAEMVVDVALEGFGELLGKRYLDPACGSGIFLVILFNRLAEEWRRKNPRRKNSTRANALIEILQTHLCGVDKSETACRITCFSLYLAFLDQLKPRDIQVLEQNQAKHGHKVLPEFLALRKTKYETPDPPVVYQGDFFARDLPLRQDFDLVIGNPPWISRDLPKVKGADEWCLSEENPYLKDAPKGKVARQQYFMPLHQIAHAFMWKAPVHVKENGRVCLLLPSKILLNKTDTFQASWFSSVTVDKIMQLADWSFILFENALCPAIIARYSPVKPESITYTIDYGVPKVSRSDPRKGVVPILPEDRKRVLASALLISTSKEEAPAFWKKQLWGTQRDARLLDRLDSLPKLCEIAGGTEEGKRWIKGQGIQPTVPCTKKQQPVWWPEEYRFISPRNKLIDLIMLAQDNEIVGDRFTSAHRNRESNKGIFHAPLVLTNQGFSKCAFIDFDAIFQHSLQSISGPEEDKEYLILLTAVINSKLADYHYFHTCANWGTERDKVLFNELLGVPFPLPDCTHDPRASNEIVSRIVKRFYQAKANIEAAAEFGREQEILSAKKDLEPLVFDYYELTQQDRMLVEDTAKIIAPSSTPNSQASKIPTLRTTDENLRKRYADTLCDTINTWGARSKEYVSAKAIVDRRLNSAVLTLDLSQKRAGYSEIESPDKLAAELERLQNVLPRQQGRFEYLRGMSVFEGKKLHILKPLELRHWTRTAALNDADEIATYVLSSGRNP